MLRKTTNCSGLVAEQKQCVSIGLWERVGILPDLRAGERLRQLRTQLGLTTREVADLSRKIAEAEGNEEFAVSHARLIQVENDESTPSVYKLFTLSAVYARPFTELVSLYLDLEATTKYQFNIRLEDTRLASFDTYSDQRPISFPVRLAQTRHKSS